MVIPILVNVAKQNNPNNKGVFFVTGYNLTDTVNIVEAVDAY
jgi:hypothetical protein